MRKKWQYFGYISFAFILVFINVSNAQNSNSANKSINLTMATSFDSITINDNLYKQYFAGIQADSLGLFVNQFLKNILKGRLTALRIENLVEIKIKEDSSKNNKENKNKYVVVNKIFVENTGLIFIDVDIISSNNRLVALSLRNNRLKLNDIMPGWQRVLKIPPNSDKYEVTNLAQRYLQKLAISLVSLIDEQIFEWIIASTIKVRVKVLPFNLMSKDTTFSYLTNGLKEMLLTELSRSKIILVQSQQSKSRLADSLLNKSVSQNESFINYLIKGSFIEIDSQLQINVHCLKMPSNRILASRKIIVDTLSMRNLSRKITTIGNQMRRIMEVDFRIMDRTLAVVGNPPKRLFYFGKHRKDDVIITREIIRALTQKLRLLSLPSDTVKTRAFLKLQILDNSKLIDKYTTEQFEPSEIIADLDVDYLITLRYEDLGAESRLTTNLYSMDEGRVEFSVPFPDITTDKALINKVIDKLFLKIMKRFYEWDFIYVPEKSIFRESQKQILNSLITENGEISNVKIPNIKRQKSFGFRAGVVAKRKSSALFAGKNSGKYCEIYYSNTWMTRKLFGIINIPPQCLDLGYEPTIGIDLVRVESIFSPLKGVFAANGFINLKVIFTKWQHANNPLLISVGSGIGAQGLRYNLHPGDEGYLGSSLFKKVEIEFAHNFFLETDFLISDEFSFHALLRKIYGSGNVFTSFQGAKIQGFDPSHFKGEFGGLYFVCGIKYHWR